MRVIKFRAWHTVEKRMVAFSLHELLANYCDEYNYADVSEEDLFQFSKETEHLVLMQFTGCQDSTGKDIHEGDIVENEDYEGRPRGVVTWLPYGFVIVKDGTKSFFMLSASWQIIGNIHEHKDLLNNK